jgi:outer membrane protein assembly factor BamB
LISIVLLPLGVAGADWPAFLGGVKRAKVVVSSSGSVDGYDPGSGELLWTFDDVGGNTVASPIPFGDGKFLVGAAPGRDGENAEGAKQSNMAMQVVKQKDGYAAEVLWRNEQATSSFGSPIVYAGYAYYTNRAGVLYCLDATTGETAYTARIGDSNWATPIGASSRVYVFGKSGETTVLAAGPEEKVLAENKLWQSEGDGGPGGFAGEIQYGVAVTDAGFVVRTGTRLFLIGG